MKVILPIIIFMFSMAITNAQDVYEDFEKSIEHSLKWIALYNAEGMAEDSAPRETNRQLKINNEYFKIMIQLQLMEMNNCKPIRNSLNSNKYFFDALKCVTEKLKGNNNSPACDVDNWGK